LENGLSQDLLGILQHCPDPLAEFGEGQGKGMAKE